ncbi:MAG: dienelactone hydrolase family protein [Acidimicrobiia bacterium]
MAEVLLFHHVLGQTPGFVGFADALRAAGHTVHTPDLFDGATFASIEDGARHVDERGFDTIVERGVTSADDLPGGLVYAGFSLGVVPAQRLAQTRPGARGAVLIEACVPFTTFGEAWPANVPVQIHGMSDDEFFAGEGDLDAARALVEAADDAELFVYPGSGHLFADPASPGYDEAAAALLLDRVLDFLARR